MVARQHDDVTMSHIDKDTQGPIVYLWAKFDFPTLHSLGGVWRQTDGQTDRQRIGAL